MARTERSAHSAGLSLCRYSTRKTSCHHLRWYSVYLFFEWKVQGKCFFWNLSFETLEPFQIQSLCFSPTDRVKKRTFFKLHREFSLGTHQQNKMKKLNFHFSKWVVAAARLCSHAKHAAVCQHVRLLYLNSTLLPKASGLHAESYNILPSPKPYEICSDP